MIFDFEPWQLDIDIDLTKVFHSGYELRDKDKHDISILESLSK